MTAAQPGKQSAGMGIIGQLRAQRLARGIPLKTVAYDLGVTEWWLCRIEHGYGKVRPLVLERWCDMLGVSWGIAQEIATPPQRVA